MDWQGNVTLHALHVEMATRNVLLDIDLATKMLIVDENMATRNVGGVQGMMYRARGSIRSWSTSGTRSSGQITGPTSGTACMAWMQI